jgi:addiction module HigA family antidote
MLLKEFLEPAGLSQAEAARRMEISLNRLNEIIKGKRSVTADTAWRFAALSDTTPESWMALQSNYDLFRARPHQLARLRKIIKAAISRRAKKQKTAV